MGTRQKRGRHRAAPALVPRVQRAAVVLVAAFVVMLGVSAAGVAAPPPGVVDTRFLADLRSRGHIVEAGTDEELLISAARKVCVLRDGRTSQQRRSVLTSQEVDAVRRYFGDDTLGFIDVAGSTYCA